MPLIKLNRINKGGEILINSDHVLFIEIESRATTVHMTDRLLFSVEEPLAASPALPVASNLLADGAGSLADAILTLTLATRAGTGADRLPPARVMPATIAHRLTQLSGTPCFVAAPRTPHS